MRRRDLLIGMGALAGAVCVPRVARSASDTRFLFILCNGGWDTTRVFHPGFDNPNVEMEPDAEPWTVGDLDLVDHPDRPQVRAFFEDFGDRCVVVNGVQIPAIDHFTCLRHLLTGDQGATDPDWASQLGRAAAGLAMPSLVLSGPVFAGEAGDAVVRAGLSGQLAGLVDPSGQPIGGESWLPQPATDAALDAAVARRSGRLGDSDAVTAWLRASERAQLLVETELDVDLADDQELEGRLGLARRVLDAGLSRCVSLEFPGAYAENTWDSHSANDVHQHALFGELFEGLAALLAEPPDDTVVVVWSEMGRSPLASSTGGRDHWPYTSALLIGDALDGGRSIGGYDDQVVGQRIDLASGELDAGGTLLTAGHLGATLLALGDVDPGARSPISGVVP